MNAGSTTVDVKVRLLCFPRAAQVLQVTRKRRGLHTRRWRTVRAYAITASPSPRPALPSLPTSWRGHWAIENGLDSSQVRTGTAPQVIACLRNLVIGALCRAGPVNLAVALRHHSRDPADHLPPSASAFDETDITQQHRSPGRGPAVIPWGGLRKVRD